MGFDMARIRVAILGAGRIAQHMADTLVKMAEDVRYADLVEPYAVAARNAVRAADFAAKYGFPVSYGSYEELVADRTWTWCTSLRRTICMRNRRYCA